VVIITQYGGWGCGDTSYDVVDFESLMGTPKRYKFPLDDIFNDDYDGALRFEEGDDVIYYERKEHVVDGKLCDKDDCPCVNVKPDPSIEKTLIYSVEMRRHGDEYVVKKVFINEDICRQEMEENQDSDMDIFYNHIQALR